MLHAYSSEAQYNIVHEARLWSMLQTCSWCPRQEISPTYCVITEKKCCMTWRKGNVRAWLLGFPMTWQELKDHTTDCYFSLINTKVLARKKDIKSLILVSHQEFDQLSTLMSSQFQFLPSCLHLKKRLLMKWKSDYVTQEIQTDNNDPSYATLKSSTSYQFGQSELNDLVLDLDLSKNAA